MPDSLNSSKMQDLINKYKVDAPNLYNNIKLYDKNYDKMVV